MLCSVAQMWVCSTNPQIKEQTSPGNNKDTVSGGTMRGCLAYEPHSLCRKPHYLLHLHQDTGMWVCRADSQVAYVQSNAP